MVGCELDFFESEHLRPVFLYCVDSPSICSIWTLRQAISGNGAALAHVTVRPTIEITSEMMFMDLPGNVRGGAGGAEAVGGL